MNSNAEHLVEHFRTKGVLVDTNLLLLYTVGKFDPSILKNQSFKRLAAYSEDDFGLLDRLMSLFPKFITTTHVLTEVSNFVGMLPRESKVDCLRRFTEIFSNFIELQFESIDLAAAGQFAYLGLTDTAISKVADQYLVLTDDARFVGHLGNLGLEAMNINHLRELVWFPES